MIDELGFDAATINSAGGPVPVDANEHTHEPAGGAITVVRVTKAKSVEAKLSRNVTYELEALSRVGFVARGWAAGLIAFAADSLSDARHRGI